ncbi:hypothetical protein ACKLNO_09050 [Neisseriaceae bacterium B1]
MKYVLSVLLLFASHFAFAEGSLKMEEVPIEYKTFYYQCNLDWQIWATPIDSMKTQLIIQRNPKSKLVESIYVLRQMENQWGGADYIGFDNGNREFSWSEEHGSEGVFGFRDKRNRLLHLACMTKDKASLNN